MTVTQDEQKAALESHIASMAQSMMRVLKAYYAGGYGSLDESEITLPHPFSNMIHSEWCESINLWRENGVGLLDDLPSRSCPACGNDKSDAIFESYDAYTYHECCSCKTWYVPKVIDHELFDRYFERVPEAKRFGDYTNKQHIDASVTDVDRARFQEYYDVLKACLDYPQNGDLRTLDIGCGVANSLAVADEVGFDTQGIEVNKNAVSVAQSLNRNVQFPSSLSENSVFDTVTLWETLEHMADPFEALKQLRPHLKPNGILALTIPNLNSPTTRSMRGDSLQIHGGPAWPGHINLYTPETLEILLKRAGFEIFHIVGQYSMNLPELFAYHTGQWSGARDYLREENPRIRLPRIAQKVFESISPGLIWSERTFAFAPILHVMAIRSDGAVPENAKVWMENNRGKLSSEMDIIVGDEDRLSLVGKHGKSMNLSENSYGSSALRLVNSKRLIFEVEETEAPYAYLWISENFQVKAKSFVRVRGHLYRGGITVGIQHSEQWVCTEDVTQAGGFEILLPANKTDIKIVIANRAVTPAPTSVHIDVIETISINL